MDVVCTIPLPTVVATAVVRNAPARFNTADIARARRGERARVEIVVAIALAASWKPVVKSKPNAIAMIRITPNCSVKHPHHMSPREECGYPRDLQYHARGTCAD